MKKRKNEENTEEIVKPKRKKKKFRILYWLTVFIVTMGLVVFLAGIGFCYYIVKSAPEFNLEEMFEKEASRVYDINGNLFATLGTEQRQKLLRGGLH